MDAHMTEEEAREVFVEVTVEVLKVSADQVVTTAKFGEDLEADSLDLAELTMALEERFDITIEETEMEGLQTVGEAFNLLLTKFDISPSA